jgi:hypothetical protein
MSSIALGTRVAAFILFICVCQLTVGESGFAAGRDSQARVSAAQAGSGARAAAICQTCDPPDPPLPPPPPPPPPPPSFTNLMSHYTAYDINGDGRAEINSLKALFPNPEPYYATANGVVIVLVDPKIVTDDPNIQMSRFEMSLWLGLLGSDISSDGFFPYFVEASVYDGPFHQDGRTVLALRRFLKEVRTYYPLAGVLLVGSFPDASIVRSVFVKANAGDPEPMNSGASPINHVGNFLALDAEFITPRAEIVLGDMDGNWEALYREAPFTVKNYHALPLLPSPSYPANGQIIETPHYQERIATYKDVFYIQDHQVTTWTDSGWLRLSILSVDEPSPEISAADRMRPNRIARPEILVSRIDPKRVAVMPVAVQSGPVIGSARAAAFGLPGTGPTTVLDLDGKSPLDANGKPQKLRFGAQTDIIWQRDRQLERKLIADYIARSHRFRLGYDNAQPFRTSAITALNSGLVSPASFNSLLRRASDYFGTSVSTDQATLLDYIVWLKQPAVLRGIAAHSDAVNSQFGKITNNWILELAAGGLDSSGVSHVWRWVKRQVGAEWWLEPSFSGLTVDANFHVHRTMFESGVLAGSGQAFYVHEGCEVMRPKNAESVPYNDPAYGQANNLGTVANGESLMFYANGLGLMARNKVFNDTPDGYYEAIKSSGGRFGFGWRAYFVKEAGNTGLNERTADPTVSSGGGDRRWRTLQRKRSYFWNTIGDFTLKIRY